MIKTPVQKAVAENPFYGMRATLNMAQQLPKLGDNSTAGQINSYLDAAWAECKGSKEKRELFFILIFSIGDIQNREHNIFRKKGIKDVDGGGVSARKAFAHCLQWIVSRVPNQFYSLLPVIGEYYNLDGMMFYEIKTDRYKGNVKEVLKLEVDMDKVTDYIASVLLNPKTSENDKKLWAKWLWHVPTTKRQKKFVVTEIGLKSVRRKYGNHYNVGDVVKGTRQKQSATQGKDNWTLNNIHLLSKKMNWEVVKYAHNVNYVGYKAFKKQYLADSEATMFSSHKIKDLDKQELLNWFDQLPSGARFRTQTRLLEKDGSTLKPRDKWINKQGLNIGTIYLEWMKSKEKAQEALRSLSTEQKEKLAKEDSKELKKMEKAAKVNTGAETMLDIVSNFFKAVYSSKEVDLIADQLLRMMNLEVPVLVIADISGSMGSASVVHKDVRFTAQRMAQLLVTIFLLKNPDQELQQMFIRFDSDSEVITTGESTTASGNNRFMATRQTVVRQLVDSTKPFSWNYNNIGQYVIARGSTRFDTVAIRLKEWVDSDPNTKSIKIEQINKYPVFLVASDGDMNNMYNAAQSVAQFQMQMRQWFGWEGVVVIWDCKEASRHDENKFEGLENVIYYGGVNTSIVNTIFKNIHDLDIVDVYTPLKSMHLSNRYAPVKELVG